MCQHGQRGEKRGEASQRGQETEGDRFKSDQRAESNNQESTRIDDARMHQGGNRRRSLHRIREPAMKGKLGGFEQGAEDEQATNNGNARVVEGSRGLAKDGRGREKFVEVPGVKSIKHQHDHSDQACIAQPAENEFLPRRQEGARSVGIEDQEAVQAPTRR